MQRTKSGNEEDLQGLRLFKQALYIWFSWGLPHLTGARNTFFDSRDVSRIMRKYEKYKNYKYLPVIHKSKDFDKKWLSSMAWAVPKVPTKVMKTKTTILTTNEKKCWVQWNKTRENDENKDLAKLAKNHWVQWRMIGCKFYSENDEKNDFDENYKNSLSAMTWRIIGCRLWAENYKKWPKQWFGIEFQKFL